MSSANQNNRDFTGNDVIDKVHSYVLGRFFDEPPSLSDNLIRVALHNGNGEKNIVLKGKGHIGLTSKENPTTLLYL